MDIASLSSIAAPGRTAAGTVAAALAPRTAGHMATKDSTPSPNGAANSGGGDSSDITADDFLTLLVSELKNQDPTQPTDPNQYITQLAQVNSLQQLISINQGIGTLDSSISSPGSPSSGNSNVSGVPS